MSLPISTPAGLKSEAIAWNGTGWRLVEAQHHVSTLKLVDTLEEQAILESLIEQTKPAIPVECRHLDYLLATPFRYGAPYPRGSRFRRQGRTAGVYYCSEQVETAVAEMAFHRLLFFAESPGLPWPSVAAEYTAVSAAIAAGRCLDLTAGRLAEHAEAWTHPTDYEACQALADAARQASVELLRYLSVRDVKGGVNLAVLSCAAFAEPAPLSRQTWRLALGRHGVQAVCEFPRAGIGFLRSDFAGDPRIASMNWDR